MKTAYTDSGVLVTRTSSSSGVKWYIAGLIDSDRLFNGSLKSLRQAVREKHGEEVEREIVDAAQMLRQSATGAK